MKKIKNFYLNCKKIGIPIKTITEIENFLLKYKGKIFIIGGNVRDLILMRRCTNNPDLVVNIDFETLTKCLREQKIKYLNVGSKFGSLVIIKDNLKFDVTSMRRDIESDGRWAKIKFTQNIEEDAQRRDFTMNSIYCDTKGNLFDPYNGINDLISKKVKFIGMDNERIDEDYLRILRFIRFSLKFSGSFNSKHLEVCRKNKNKLKKLSYERRISELEKILLDDNIKKRKIIDQISDFVETSLESKLNFQNFSKLCEFEKVNSLKSFERRIKFLVRSLKKKNKFLIDNADSKLKKRLLSKIKFENYSIKEIKINLYSNHKDYVLDQLIFDYLDKIVTKKKFESLFNVIIYFKEKQMPVNGDDLIKIGFMPGKKLGKVLEAIKSFCVDRNFKCTREECIKFAKNIYHDA